MSKASTPVSSIARGSIYMCVASLSVAFMNVSAKVVSEVAGSMTALFIRSAIMFLLTLPVAVFAGGSIVEKKPWLLFLRGIIGSAALACLFLSLKKLSAAEATLLRETAPLFVLLFAPWYLRETVSRGMVIATVIGFIGVTFVLKPWSGLIQVPALIGLLGGILAAHVMMILRAMRGMYPTHAIVITFAMCGMLLGAAGGGFSGVFLLKKELLPWVAALGITGTVYQLLLTSAYRYAPASIISPLALLSVVFAAIADWVMFGAKPDGYSIFGFVLIAIGVGSVPIVVRGAKAN
jgi:drug/metabolite transporter (DMT)-like permease